jgi:O-antigen ligase
MAAGEAIFAADSTTSNVIGRVVGAFLRPLQFLMAEPSLVFLATLGLMLFHSPDGPAFLYDRLALGILILAVFLRTRVLQQPLWIGGRLAGPLFALLLLALSDGFSQPYRPEIWSVFAAKWFVPLTLFIAAANIFESEIELRQFETFALVAFIYLSLTAIFFIIGAKNLIFPRFILDEGIGIHADRARGPFLQAVANGLAINLLGLIALDSFRRRRLRGILGLLLLAMLPLAILATKTRAVWLSCAASIGALALFSASRRLRRTCMVIVICSVVAITVLASFTDHHRSLSERLEEDGPVEFRLAIYQAGWRMFLEKPLAGWGGREMQVELARRISDFHQEEYYFHNTFLEILVQYGLFGLILYVWLTFELFRVGRTSSGDSRESGFLDREFRRLWPIFLLVYIVNAMCVVMNYQFVNGFVFSIAGMLNAQNRRAQLNVSY